MAVVLFFFCKIWFRHNFFAKSILLNYTYVINILSNYAYVINILSNYTFRQLVHSTCFRPWLINERVKDVIESLKLFSDKVNIKWSIELDNFKYFNWALEKNLHIHCILNIRNFFFAPTSHDQPRPPTTTHDQPRPVTTSHD